MWFYIDTRLATLFFFFFIVLSYYIAARFNDDIVVTVQVRLLGDEAAVLGLQI